MSKGYPTKKCKKRLQFNKVSDTEECNKSLTSEESELEHPAGLAKSTERRSVHNFVGIHFRKMFVMNFGFSVII